MFKAPAEIERHRVLTGPYKSPSNATFGSFRVPLKYSHGGRVELTILAYDGEQDGWEHVSISTQKRCPTWEEMCRVKSWFWDDEDCVMQLHPPKSEWISMHPYCLHLWRPIEKDIPRPPNIAVGVKNPQKEKPHD